VDMKGLKWSYSVQSMGIDYSQNMNPWKIFQGAANSVVAASDISLDTYKSFCWDAVFGVSV